MKMHLFTILPILSLTSALALAGGAQPFTAHEWGTFTSVQGADGVQAEWNPLIRTDLPSFVHDPAKLAASGCEVRNFPEKAAVRALIRLETPVIYFYSPAAQRVDVHVDFPSGRITEWYPRASRVAPYTTETQPAGTGLGRSYIEWRGVSLLAPETAEISAGGLMRQAEYNHYYAARETDANFLRMDPSTPIGQPEYDRLLFYRGVGNSEAPLEVKVSPNETELILSTASRTPLTHLFALTIRNGQARFQSIAQVSAAKTQAAGLSAGPFVPLIEARGRLMSGMRTALVEQGLFASEADAMVNTWKDQWFAEEGTRILYLLPRDWTDRTLPLTIHPQPAHLVRVMVGRSEVLLPAVEKDLRQQILLYSSGDRAAKDSAVATVRRLGLGRFLAPAVERVLAANPRPELVDPAWELARVAGEQPTQRSAGSVQKGDEPIRAAELRVRSPEVATTH